MAEPSWWRDFIYCLAMGHVMAGLIGGLIAFDGTMTGCAIGGTIGWTWALIILLIGWVSRIGFTVHRAEVARREVGQGAADA